MENLHVHGRLSLRVFPAAYQLDALVCLSRTTLSLLPARSCAVSVELSALWNAVLSITAEGARYTTSYVFSNRPRSTDASEIAVNKRRLRHPRPCMWCFDHHLKRRSVAQQENETHSARRPVNALTSNRETQSSRDVTTAQITTHHSLQPAGEAKFHHRLSPEEGT